MTEKPQGCLCKKMNETRKPKAIQKRLDSITGVYPVHTQGLGIWKNLRAPMTTRVDMKTRMKKWFRENYGPEVVSRWSESF